MQNRYNYWELGGVGGGVVPLEALLCDFDKMRLLSPMRIMITVYPAQSPCEHLLSPSVLIHIFSYESQEVLCVDQ